MNQLEFPKAQEADICLILEGTYPFVGGGVSHWARELIRVLPQYSFAIIFLGTSAEDYTGFHSSLLPNVVHLEAHFLFEKQEHIEHSTGDIAPEIKSKIIAMHEKFGSFIQDQSETMPELFELMGNSTHLNKDLFLHSKTSWELLVKKYQEQYSEQSFFDYFWGIRSLHRPFWELAKIVDSVPKFKVLHSASTGYAGFLGALLQKKYDLPLVLTEHGIYTKERWIELISNYFFENVVKENALFSRKSGLLEVWVRFFSMLAKITYNAANPIISLFDGYQARQIADGARPERTQIMSYGIDFAHYPFIDKQLNQTKPVVAFIGRVVPIKDAKTFIRASALLIKKLPQVEAWIVGSLSENKHYVANCKKLVEMLELEDKIKFIGEQKMMEIYPQIDLLLMTSISEGSPFVMLESFAVGLPVVSTDVGGCRELIEGKDEEDKLLGLAGRIVPMADAEGIANAAYELLTDEQTWNNAKQTAATRVRKYYSMDQLIQNYTLIYDAAIAHGRNWI
ncbi:MAG: GT4 family glycosyltransferase PelF [Legionella sp.]|uniref:GT4 family glycosyltransferase PelF n=1 Tax=Legionella sp. TaxID=459 RepID=UPI00284F9F20|nr:GT4 family glycosyltransferase PelF [Legionella sp.]